MSLITFLSTQIFHHTQRWGKRRSSYRPDSRHTIPMRRCIVPLLFIDRRYFYIHHYYLKSRMSNSSPSIIHRRSSIRLLSSSLGQKQETLKVLPSASVTKATKRGTPRPGSSSSSSSNKKIKTQKETETVSANAASQKTTHSFEPAWWGNSISSTDTALVDVNNNYPPIHTLILGTHPSITSLQQNELYAHTQNAFWYIVGDVLHFRRNAALSTTTTNNKNKHKPYATYYNYLRYSNIIPYKEQLELLVSKGFALWDIIATCERKGSLDVDIRNEEPNCIREFCEGRYPSLLPSSFKVEEEEGEGCKTTNNNGNYVKCEKNNKYVNIQRIIIANGTTGAYCL
jgi:hypothetical protein